MGNKIQNRRKVIRHFKSASRRANLYAADLERPWIHCGPIRDFLAPCLARGQSDLNPGETLSFWELCERFVNPGFALSKDGQICLYDGEEEQELDSPQSATETRLTEPDVFVRHEVRELQPNLPVTNQTAPTCSTSMS